MQVAALVYARARGPEEDLPLTAADALRVAAAEGLTLERSESAASGFK